MPDFLVLIVSLLVGVMAALLAEWILRVVRVFDKTRRLRHLLGFAKTGRLYLIYPPRQTSEDALLARMSTEDFMAINNFISALLLIDRREEQNPIIVRQLDQVPADYIMGSNVVVFCSPKSNGVADAIQRALEDRFANHNSKPYFHYPILGSKGPRWEIRRPGGAFYRSDTYDEYERLLNQPDSEPIHQHDFHDFAVITKVRNPWNPHKHWIMLIAGIRGIGTWGAAEALKKNYDPIFKKLKDERVGVDGSFSAVLRIHYHNSDILSTNVDSLVGLDDTDIPPMESRLTIPARPAIVI